MIVVDSSALIAILEEESDAVKRLEILAAATSLNDLRTLPSNHREALERRPRKHHAARRRVRVDPVHDRLKGDISRPELIEDLQQGALTAPAGQSARP
jgi:uncharacterized protein with PIN domain